MTRKIDVDFEFRNQNVPRLENVLLIAFAGLPSAGKSTTTKALADLLGAASFLEPEEDQWPEAVHCRELVGCFTALTWFRSIRVPKLYAASEESRAGKICLVDSYYDVLLGRYLGTEPFSWLLQRSDPYYNIASQMAAMDWSELPRADVLILLRIDEETWARFIDRRSRSFDRLANLKNQFAMQKLLEGACQDAATQHGTHLMTVDQNDSSPIETANRIKTMLLPLL